MRANMWLWYTRDCCSGPGTKQWAASVLVPPTQVCTYFLICSDINNSDLESETCWNLSLNINVQCNYLRICVFVIPQLPKDPMRALPNGSLLQKKSFADLVDSLESTHSETLERFLVYVQKGKSEFFSGLSHSTDRLIYGHCSHWFRVVRTSPSSTFVNLVVSLYLFTSILLVDLYGMLNKL